MPRTNNIRSSGFRSPRERSTISIILNSVGYISRRGRNVENATRSSCCCRENSRCQLLLYCIYSIYRHTGELSRIVHTNTPLYTKARMHKEALYILYIERREEEQYGDAHAYWKISRIREDLREALGKNGSLTREGWGELILIEIFISYFDFELM